MKRFLLATLIGNALGWGAWALGWRALPLIWANVEGTAGWGALIGRVAVSAMMMAAPPVLIGALTAWLARRAHAWAGLASGLWSMTLIQATPESFPIMSQIWFAPTVLILLSALFGGWMLDLRAQAKSTFRDS
jgi:hypothetical protein